MNVITFVTLCLFAILFSYITKKYVRLSMVLFTSFFVAMFIFLFINHLYLIISLDKMGGDTSVLLTPLVMLILMALLVILKNHISLTVIIIDFWINKKRLLEEGHVEKGIIEEIKTYSYTKNINNISGYYLIVDLNGEKIKSLPFNYMDGTFYDKQASENLKGTPQAYKVGDEIDVIVYENKKYVKLKEYEENNY